MAVQKRCRPMGRRAEYCARLLQLLEEYPDQEFSCRQIAQELGTREPDSILFLTLLVVGGKVTCLRRDGTLYYRRP